MKRSLLLGLLLAISLAACAKKEESPITLPAPAVAPSLPAATPGPTPAPISEVPAATSAEAGKTSDEKKPIN